MNKDLYRLFLIVFYLSLCIFAQSISYDLSLYGKLFCVLLLCVGTLCFLYLLAVDMKKTMLFLILLSLSIPCFASVTYKDWGKMDLGLKLMYVTGYSDGLINFRKVTTKRKLTYGNIVEMVNGVYEYPKYRKFTVGEIECAVLNANSDKVIFKILDTVKK